VRAPPLPLYRARDATRNQPWICGRFTAKPAAEGYQAGPENVRLATRSFRTGLALNETTLRGPMVMAVPVFGLRPSRECLCLMVNVPKPDILTLSPARNRSLRI